MRFQHALELTSEELNQLTHLIQTHRTPQALARRAQLIKLFHAHPDWGTKQVARTLNHHESWGRKWRRRWNQTHILKDAPRAGAPRRFSPEVPAQVTALACSLPRSHGLPFSRWSRAELARQAACTPSLPSLSASTIGRWLAAEKIRPWRYHSWQHIQQPEEFLQRARPVLHLYEQASVLRHRKASGSFVRMRKPPSRHGRLSKLLAQQCLGILPPCLPVIIGGEQ